MTKRVTGDEGDDIGTARAWCLTFYVPDGCRPVPGEDACRYFVCQREVCPETGRVHWQAYCEFKEPVRGTKLLQAIRVELGDQRFRQLRRGEIHWERRRGRRDQARDYCRKEESRDPREGSGPFECGRFRIIKSLEQQHIGACWDLYINGEVEDRDDMNDPTYVCFIPIIKL